MDLSQNLEDRHIMLATLQGMAVQVSGHLQGQGLAGRTVGIKVRFADFTTVTRAYSYSQAIWRPEAIHACLPGLLDKAIPAESQVSVRLLGLTVSALSEEGAGLRGRNGAF